MSWRFPKRVPRTNHPLSPEDLADGVRPFFEVSGDINEHNIDAASITSGLTAGVDTDNDIAYRIKEINNYDYDKLFDQTKHVKYTVTAGWEELADTEMEFSTEGGPFLIFAAIDYGMLQSASTMAQAQFVVMLNGSPYIESGVGCFDKNSISGVHETGVGSAQSRCCIDAAIFIPSGKHRLSLGIGVRPSPKVEDTGGPAITIRNTQFVCVELAR